jgi:hypothetical protein
LRNDEAACPVTIDSLVALNNVLNRIKLKLSGSATASLDTTEFQKCAIGWNEYSKKFMQRVTLMKQNPRIEPVKPEGDQFSVNPDYILDKTKITLFSSKLGDAVLDPICHLTTHRFEALYEKRNLAAAALNMKKVTSDQLTELQHLLRMDMQYLAGCSVEWRADDGAAPAAKGAAPAAKVAARAPSILPGAGDENLSILPGAKGAAIPAGE